MRSKKDRSEPDPVTTSGTHGGLCVWPLSHPWCYVLFPLAPMADSTPLWAPYHVFWVIYPPLLSYRCLLSSHYTSTFQNPTHPWRLTSPRKPSPDCRMASRMLFFLFLFGLLFRRKEGTLLAAFFTVFFSHFPCRFKDSLLILTVSPFHTEVGVLYEC